MGSGIWDVAATVPVVSFGLLFESISMKISVLVLASRELIFFKVAVVFWIWYKKNVDNTDQLLL